MTVKSKIVYPHLGIIDEVEEEVFAREGEDQERKEADANE